MKILKKQIYIPILCISAIIFLYFFQTHNNELNIQAKAAILMDAESGKIIYKKNEDMPFAPASMSKMMTEYIVLEQIENGSIKWDDSVTISSKAVNSEGVKIYVKDGDRLTVRELFHAMVISSANNAAIALAEHISKSEKDFTLLMNEKAKQLQLSTQTHFVNATGLANEKNEESKMTALDAAKLAQHLIKSYPNILEVTKLTSFNLRGTTVNTTNKMLYPSNRRLYFKEVDGLKTGFTDAAGYCFTGTAKQDGKRLISVVMGTSNGSQRFIETKKLFSYGFDKLYIPFL
ncbi:MULTISPECIES: D-alanyl-D-alanine carboxypeptidase family protein [Bacillus]|uniref:D-alanyl-D-alanine carboxypeptidase family protein n=1 Tax=Bacillus TaxID=1386 RepID=UPI000469906D|nr:MULTISPECIES: D-alanyl-D-alanine carboxypeptidase family protein [Bacillus]MED1411237.1 D-alanyl-D-alanine carboxypeptidase [Bacillus paramycoides]MED1466478.1 D-alanyl-D-alanine carboxypeptidase [Bacillus paramycoides]MED1495615.1 D-alanyl-D-alanine carboxypeptidase [Bacillus paramycoides]